MGLVDSFYPEPNNEKVVDQSNETFADGGGYRFIFNDGPPPKRKKELKKKHELKPPVELNISNVKGTTPASEKNETGSTEKPEKTTVADTISKAHIKHINIKV